MTQEKLKAIFDYHPDGFFIDKGNRRLKKDKGKLIKGSINGSEGYLRFNAFGKYLAMHRMVFLYHHGYLPKVVDHIDRNKLNNKIENLRESTLSQNRANSKLTSKNTSGYKGVSKMRNKWRVQIEYCGKTHRLGCFECPIVAALAYDKKALELFGEFANTNFKPKSEKDSFMLAFSKYMTKLLVTTRLYLTGIFSRLRSPQKTLRAPRRLPR